MKVSKIAFGSPGRAASPVSAEMRIDTSPGGAGRRCSGTPFSASAMRNIEASEWLTDPSLDILETKGAGDGGSDFTLNALQENPQLTNANGADQQVASAPAGPKAGARR